MKITDQFNKKLALPLMVLLSITGAFAQCPGNMTVPASAGQCGATVTYTTPGGGTGGQSENGIVNPSAANGLNGWTIGLNGGSGWATEGGFFKTSFSTCTKSQVVTLTSLGVTESYLDTAPAITISDDYIGWESNYNDTYSLTVELRGASNNVIASYTTGNITTSSSLQTASHTFTGYGPGVRKVYFSHGGVDIEWWLGNFGAAMTNAQVRVAMPVGGTAVQTGGLASGAFFPVGTTTNTFTITDGVGNVTNCSFNVVVTDSQAPVVITQPITIALDATGTASITPEQVNNGSTDNCGIAGYTLNNMTFDCENIGTNNVTLTVTDTHGNSATGTAVITVEDNIIPIAIAQDLTIALDAAGVATITPAQVNNNSTDNCTLTYILDISSFDSNDLGENTVTLTVTDADGNTSTDTAVITVEDTIPPVAAAHDMTITLDATGTASITPEEVNNNSTDNSEMTYSLDVSTFTCEDAGENTVTLTVTDAGGNISTATAIITIEDEIAPTATAHDITISLNESLEAVITAEDIDDNSSDNCSIATYSVDTTVFNCDNIGENIVTLTITDAYGNTATDTAIVTVNDAENHCEAAGTLEYSFKDIKIYPNPTSGSFTISGLKEEVNRIGLYDISGRLIQDIVPGTADISQLNAGIYFLKISGDTGSITKEIIKQ